jgi:hypothetical protein
MKKTIIILLVFYTAVLHAETNSAFIETQRGLQPVRFSLNNHYAVVEGDILLAKDTELKPGSVVVKTQSGRWENGIVPYKIDPNLPVENQKNVLQAMIEWLNHSHLKFINVSRLKESPYQDYILFTSAPGTECSSYVGRHGGVQVVRLAPRCNVFNTTHEIGHALGLWHEQSRSDRNNYIRIVWENIEPEMMHKFEQHLNDGEDIGDYDYESLMHYGPYAFSSNGKQTIVPLKESAEIGQRTHLSNKDIKAINTLYPN